MYTFDRDTKCIVTPSGDHIKGKAVTEHLNNMYAMLDSLMLAWQGLHFIMQGMDSVFIPTEGEEDGNGEVDATPEPEVREGCTLDGA